MKIRRSNRLVDITRYLLEHPHKLVSLKSFSEQYGAAKSSISEDLSIVKRTMAEFGLGKVDTVPGASGGAFFAPRYSKENAEKVVGELVTLVDDPSRLLPGGYVYLSDLLGRPEILREVGQLIATQYIDADVDVIMTVETKGIPLAQAVAMYLNKPFVIVRNSSHITEGSTVSVNYVSGSSKRIKKMELSRRTLKEGANVVIIDDFLKGGGTMKGMQSLIKEFDAHLVGMNVFAEGQFEGERLVSGCTSLIKVTTEEGPNDYLKAEPGNFLTRVFTEGEN
ncbi:MULTISPECIES: pur operon repressor [Lactobacillaceae]|uniref:Pur operon repressor n=1 Tax=Limosilactobacillus alvi TaxID=990412 RepID=A0ABS2EN38_9LACO|nr:MULTISPECIES: pur operon repressor [Lactobacillaceae]MBM6753838.1 pur operon repressor [Limosilactobacillus alvi]QLL69323.1 pur operon repressor [Lactobacillus sp. 3B(2020)]